jgi:hypothetical protein
MFIINFFDGATDETQVEAELKRLFSDVKAAFKPCLGVVVGL